MRIRLAPKAALAALAAVGLFLPFGAPLPGSCLRTIGVAGAAPSPSCSGDLRECLRASADLRQRTFGGRYVTADDVARCMEAFRSCVSGGASRGGSGSPSKSATAPDGDGKNLPERFGITINDSPPQIVAECARNGDQVRCDVMQTPLPEGTDSFAGEFNGSMSGMTITGTYTEQTTSTDATGCKGSAEAINTVTYTFTPDGNVSLSWEPYEMKGTVNCPGTGVAGSTSTPIPPGRATGKWSPTG